MTPVQVTDRAARRISEIIAGEAPAKMLRVSVKAGGCTGFQYAFDLVSDRETGRPCDREGRARRC